MAAHFFQKDLAAPNSVSAQGRFSDSTWPPRFMVRQGRIFFQNGPGSFQGSDLAARFSKTDLAASGRRQGRFCSLHLAGGGGGAWAGRGRPLPASAAGIGRTSARGAREGARPQQLHLLGSPARRHPARARWLPDPRHEPGGSSCDATRTHSIG